MKNKVIFYKKANGLIPVYEFILRLPSKHKAKAIKEIELLEEFGTNLKEPYAKSISNYKGLWELRIKFANDISRIFYFMPIGNLFVLLHGFVKKTQKTPVKEIEIAYNNMKEYLRRNNPDEN